MAYCISNSLAGIATDCEGSLGGIKTVYLTTFQDGIFNMSGETVTGFTTGVTHFYEYQFKPETSNFTSTLNKTAAGGSYVTTEINLVFSRMDAAKRVEMNALALDDLAAVVADANGKYWAFGRWLPVVSSTATGESGTAYGDANQYTVTLTASDQNFAPELSDGAITALKALVSTN